MKYLLSCFIAIAGCMLLSFTMPEGKVKKENSVCSVGDGGITELPAFEKVACIDHATIVIAKNKKPLTRLRFSVRPEFYTVWVDLPLVILLQILEG